MYDRIYAEFQYIGGKYMFESIENLKIENIHRGTSKMRSSVTSRKTNTLLFRTSGCLRYYFPECTMEVPKGNIVFVPRGAAYNTAVTETPCNFVSISFSATLPENTPPFTVSLDGFHGTEELENSLPDLWKFGGRPERYKCYSFFYSLLSYLDFLENQSNKESLNEKIISPAVIYLKSHIYDCDLKLTKLQELCGISGTYFRRLFKARFGESPQEYVLSKRLSHAKAIIESGDFSTITEVAYSVGYSDSLYFSRAFKKKYGLSPAHYNSHS